MPHHCRQTTCIGEASFSLPCADFFAASEGAAKIPQFSQLSTSAQKKRAGGRAPRPPSVARSGMDPATLFGEYYRRRNGQGEAPAELHALFAELYEEASR